MRQWLESNSLEITCFRERHVHRVRDHVSLKRVTARRRVKVLLLICCRTAVRPAPGGLLEIIQKCLREFCFDRDLDERREYLVECSLAVMLGIAPCLSNLGRNRELGGWNRANQHKPKHTLGMNCGNVLCKLAALAESNQHKPLCASGIGYGQHVLRKLVEGVARCRLV